MANCSWFERFPAGRCEYLRFEGSDHRPVVVHFDVQRKRKKGLFRFDRRLKDKPEIRQLVTDQWNRDPWDTVLSKIETIRAGIIRWTKEQNLNSNRLIQETQVKLEAALSSPTPDTRLIEELTNSLEAAYKDEEQFWRQRSRIQWLQSGDKNTAFFYAATRGRRAITKFAVIEDSSGRAKYKEEEIVRCITEFYSNIFSSQMSNSAQTVNEGISPLVTTEMNQTLIALPSPLEIKDALFSISPDKAPGPDGFSASFYQSFWDIIGEDVTRDVQSFFSSGVIDPRQMKPMSG